MLSKVLLPRFVSLFDESKHCRLHVWKEDKLSVTDGPLSAIAYRPVVQLRLPCWISDSLLSLHFDVVQIQRDNVFWSPSPAYGKL